MFLVVEFVVLYVNVVMVVSGVGVVGVVGWLY